MLARFSLNALILLLVMKPFAALSQTPCRGVGLSQFGTEHYDKLVDMNVNLVRYTFVWDDPIAADASDSTTYNAWLDEELDFFDDVLTELESRNISVVLNLHTPPGGFASRTGEVTHKVFTELWAQTEIVNAWQKIATRYLGRSSIYAYDLLNEPAQFSATVPTGLKNWNALAKDIIEAIRVIEPGKKIMMTSRFGDPKHFNNLEFLNYDNIVYTFHFYSPFQYTHQGIAKDKKWKKKSYPDPKVGLNKKKLKKAMKNAFAFQAQHGVELYVGEFAAARWAPGGDKYINDVIKIFESKNICWSYESFGYVDVWSFEYTTDRDNKEKSPTPTARENILRGFFEKNG